jgi:hypothetical protein
MKSPLREKDDNPSFGYFPGENNEIYFKDFVLGGGDFIKFVEIKFGIPYYDAMSRIIIDFSLGDHFFFNPQPAMKSVSIDNPQKKEDVIRSTAPIKLTKRARKWAAHDYAYWNQFGVTKNILNEYKVEPIDYIFINTFPIKVDKYAYCFIEHKDGKETYKIYQPFNLEYKWRNNHDYSTWQGWNQLPRSCEFLIITKSLKDVMSIVSTTKYPAVSLQAESVIPKDHIINELKSRFNEIYVLYDNDYDKDLNWGQKYATNLVHKFNLTNIVINAEWKSKDYSDAVKNHGSKKAKKILEESIANGLPF